MSAALGKQSVIPSSGTSITSTEVLAGVFTTPIGGEAGSTIISVSTMWVA